MSTLEDLDDLEREQKEDKKDDGEKNKKPDQNGDAEMKDAEPEKKEEDPIDEEIYSLSTQDILTRRRLLENDSRIMKSEFQRLSHEKATMGEKIKDNLDKIENNRYVEADALWVSFGDMADIYKTITIPSGQCC
jgi:26S proteasome regulatory subunit T5